MSRLACASLFALPLVLAMAPSCKVGDFSEQDPNAGTNDAAVAAFDASNVGGADAQPSDPDCEESVLPNGAGQHNPGLSCIVGGCHDGNTADVPLWTLAGTAYTDINGTTPLAGGTILYTDANGLEVKMVTAQNGNFYTSQAVAFPIQATASRCPNTLPMNTAIADNMGSCNAAGCHDIAGNRIYVPE